VHTNLRKKNGGGNCQGDINRRLAEAKTELGCSPKIRTAQIQGTREEN
jgi:hypothetical protein